MIQQHKKRTLFDTFLEKKIVVIGVSTTSLSLERRFFLSVIEASPQQKQTVRSASWLAELTQTS